MTTHQHTPTLKILKITKITKNPENPENVKIPENREFWGSAEKVTFREKCEKTDIFTKLCVFIKNQ